MKANSEKTKQSKKATCRVLAGVLCGASVLSLVLSLVMPPISQAIANDAEAGAAEKTVAAADSSTESTDVDNTTGGDAENQKSDETESDEADPSNGVEQGQPEGKLQAEDGELSDGNAVMLAADGGQTKTAPIEIQTADELKKLANASGVASFKLMNDVETSETITLNNGSNITLNLNGHKIKYTNQSQPLFNITGGATLTIKDLIKDSDSEKDPEKASEKRIKVQELNDQGQNLNPANYGKAAEFVYNDGIPSSLTYYVTESSPSTADITKTTETLFKYSVNIYGAIVACGGNENLTLININDGGHFSLESGVLTQQEGCQVRNLVHAWTGSNVNMKSTVEMKGGYVCGGYCPDHAAGAGISVENSTLSISDGVIAGNCAPSGGGVYANGSAVKVTGGVISGNSTNSNGYGGGIMAENGGSVTVSGGYITNNRYANFCGNKGDGCHGGAGLATSNGAHVTISGGQITGNYSEEAGGGVYVTSKFQPNMTWLNITGGNIASNVSRQSEGAGIRVGQRVDVMINGPKESNGTKESKVYITNNTCLSRFDWGGGGIFVQGSSQNAADAGRLFVYNSYISTNTAGGYGGGVAVCPTGKTLVTYTDGTAIFGNTDAGAADSYNSENNNNDGNPHLSGGGGGKTEDKEAYYSADSNGYHVFRNSGHADFFIAAKGNTTPVAVVSGKMLGDIDAKYSGSIELTNCIAIPANGAAQVKNSIGLSSGVDTRDKTTIDAVRNKATTFITGNYSWDHGGGIMSNGNLYLGEPADTYILPSLKLKATKALINQQANQQTNQNMNFHKGKFSFSVYRMDSDDATEPYWNDKTFNSGGCTLVGTAKNDGSGNITFDLGEQYIDKAVKANEITYYLVENAGNDPGITYDPDITYDPAVYKIVVKVQDNTTQLMKVPSRKNPNLEVPLCIHNYKITSVSLGDSPNPLKPNDQGYYSIDGPDGGKTFTNVYTPYKSTGSWTPKATKVVKGGEMKEFTLQLATDYGFQDIIRETKTTGDKNKQTLSFLDGSDKGIEYSLSDITKDPDVKGDPTGRGASKTFTYFVREQLPTMPFTNYKYDKSVYQFDVTMTDQTDGTIKATKVTYTKIEGVDGKPIDDQEPINFDSTNPEELGPTFTNTYSTSLPLSGMSGVTLTYLAGAAVLCAAAAWMHIRRKANAKGGERRE